MGGHVFDYGQKGSADQMRTSYEKLVQYVGTSMGTDILNELRNKVTAVVPEPVEDPVVTARHAQRKTVVRDGQARMLAAKREQEVLLTALVAR